ncbi:MAG TPA: hypothetical protein VJB65_00480 [Patescibacteria group bacterium]|nr:hypothetical protein [Patescibacteria group bacterium]
MKRFIITCAIALFVWMPATTAHAATLLPSCARGNGDCSTCEILQLFHNASKLATELLSAVLLFTFILGGFWWLVSGGNGERVKKGTQVITGSLIGLVFVFMGYMMVNLVISGFMGSTVGSSAEKGKDMVAKLFTGIGSGERWDTICDVKLPTPTISPTSDETTPECLESNQCEDSEACVESKCISRCEDMGYQCVSNPVDCDGTILLEVDEDGDGNYDPLCPEGQDCCGE